MRSRLLKGTTVDSLRTPTLGAESFGSLGRTYLARRVGFALRGDVAITSAASSRTFLFGLCMSLAARERWALVGFRVACAMFGILQFNCSLNILDSFAMQEVRTLIA